MKIAIIGASGFVGSRILSEALNRGHEVTAVVTNPDKLPADPRLRAVKGDATDSTALTPLLAEHDLVISAFNPGKDESGAGPRSIIDAAKRSGVARLLVVGGAGTLEVAPGQRVVDQPDFPQEWKAGALKTAVFLELLSGEAELDWVFISPAAVLAPGERTGKYRVGGERLMTGPDGQSRISIEDYAMAMLDESETPRHSRERFSVAD